jgi:hypothetical protein
MMARNVRRPMRPNPLMATRIVIVGSLLPLPGKSRERARNACSLCNALIEINSQCGAWFRRQEIGALTNAARPATASVNTPAPSSPVPPPAVAAAGPSAPH